MQKSTKNTIVIIGCGNVAWHIAKQLNTLKKYSIIVYNHKENSLLNDFKTHLKCKINASLNAIIIDADVYFICVTDKMISSVAKKITPKKENALIVHTSGSMKIDTLGVHKNTAVFYPVQTFSKNDDISWQDLPIIIEANNQVAKTIVLNLANAFSNYVKFLNYKERLKLHLAAVLVNNFTNALYVAAEKIIPKNLEEKNFQLLMPLIKNTITKLEKIGGLSAQTGPAKRKDEVVMKKHLKLLSPTPNLKQIYKAISQLIIKQQTKKHA